MKPTFGPAIYHDKTDGSFRPTCAWCTFRTGYGIVHLCRHVEPMRKIPDIEHTPEWCEMLEGMLADAKAAS